MVIPNIRDSVDQWLYLPDILRGRTDRSDRCATREVLSGLVSQIVFRVDEFEAKRSDGRHLADVLTGFCPMKVVRVARQNDDAAGRIGSKLLGIEAITEADVENTGDNCVDAILGVFVRHELYPGRNFDPDRVGPGLCWIADNGGVVHARWKTRISTSGFNTSPSSPPPFRSRLGHTNSLSVQRKQ